MVPWVGMAAIDDNTQRLVAAHRENVLGGRGPGATRTETDRCKRERPYLGRLPAPLEREMVHLRTAAFRRGTRTSHDASAVEAQTDRLAQVWGVTSTDTQSADASSADADRVDRSHALARLGLIGAVAGAVILGRRLAKASARRA